MIEPGERLLEEIDRLVPQPDARDASWDDALRRAGSRAQARSRGRRRQLAAAALAGATAVTLALSPLGGAIGREIGDFSAWLTGAPGEPASEDEQRAFERANERSWAGFPDGPQLRRLAQARAAGATFELFGFRTGSSLCLRLTVTGIAAVPATGCAPIGELGSSRDPALVVVTDYSFGQRQGIEPTAEGLVPPQASATFGIVADGIEQVELVSNRGRHDAIVRHNAFLAVVAEPALGLRTQQALATASDGRRYTVAIAQSPFGTEQPVARPGVAPGPREVERAVEGGTIGWLLRRESRGQSLEEAGLAGERLFMTPRSNVSFARVLKPDPLGYMRVAIMVTDEAPGPGQPPQAPPGAWICSFVIGRTGAGGGCSPEAGFFSRGPFTVGTSIEHGGNQYAVLSGLASDEVERIELFLATGERIAVPLQDNVFIVEAARMKYPARLVAYDGAGRVIGIEAMAHDPLADPGPRPVDVEQRVVLEVVGENGTRGVLRIGPSTDGGRCWRVTFTGGAGGGGCPPKGTRSPPVALGIQNAGSDSFVTGKVAARVTSVEVRFASGGSATVEPVERFVLYPIPSDEDVTLTVGRDADGDEVGRYRFTRRP